MKWVLLALALAGCTTAQSVVYVAKPVPVYVERKPEVDPEWLKPCPVESAKELSAAEAKRLAEARRQIIIKCANADKAKIRNAIENTDP